MIIKPEKKNKIGGIVNRSTEKLGKVLHSIDKQHINYFCDNVSTQLLNEPIYQRVYTLRSMYMMHLIRMIAEINQVILLGHKASGLAELYNLLSNGMKCLPNYDELSYIDVQFLYKSSLEVSNNFLRYDKDKNEYYRKDKLNYYEIIESIDKFSFTVRYVLNNYKKGNEEK